MGNKMEWETDPDTLIDGKQYLITSKENCIYTGWWRREDGWHTWLYSHNTPTTDVKAWMPLPGPYDQKKADESNSGLKRAAEYCMTGKECCDDCPWWRYKFMSDCVTDMAKHILELLDKVDGK